MTESVKIQLSPRAKLTYIHSEKFKTACAAVYLQAPFTKETASLNALLPRVLRRGTSRLPDMGAIQNELDELYGANVSPYASKAGEVHLIGSQAMYIDDDFIPGCNQTERAFGLLGEMLTSPATDGGLFVRDYVESEKKNQIDSIMAEINNKPNYAVNSLLRNMCADEPFGTYALGTIEDTQKITPKSLMEQYRELLGASCLDMYYCGAAPCDKIELAVRAALAPLLGDIRAVEPETKILTAPPAPDVRYFTEKMDVAQGILALGFRMGETMLEPNYPALNVFNSVYGGSVTSKLFMNVREKLSLCYFASSGVNTIKGIMTVRAGIDFSKREIAEAEILAQLDAMKRGEITDDELTSAKRALISSGVAMLDTSAGVSAAYADMAFLKLKCSPEEFYALHDSVTIDDIVAIADSVKLDSIFFLDRQEAAE